jgi:hypothetical protein
VKSEYQSDNSVSLPGITGSGGPVGFEPGMFRKEDGSSLKSDSSTKVLFVSNSISLARVHINNSKFLLLFRVKRRRRTVRSTNISISTNMITNTGKIRTRKKTKKKIRIKRRKKNLR